MSATASITFESAPTAQAKSLIQTTMSLWSRGQRILSELRPLLRFGGIYALSFATCFPAWMALENSMSLIGLGLLGVAFLLMLVGLETTGDAVGADDLV